MNKIRLLMMGSVLALSVQTSFAAEPLSLENTSIVDLNIDQPEVTLAVSYPGEDISGVCAIDIVADSFGREIPIKNLLNAVSFSDTFGNEGPIRPKVVSKTTLRIPLAEGGFLGGVKIQTKKGQSLFKAVAETLGENRELVALPRSCK